MIKVYSEFDKETQREALYIYNQKTEKGFRVNIPEYKNYEADKNIFLIWAVLMEKNLNEILK